MKKQFSASAFFEIDQYDNPFAHWSLKDFELELEAPHSHCEGLLKEGQLQGFVFFRVIAEEAQIMNMAVVSKRQGCGSLLLQQLLRRLEGEFAEVEKLLLEVRLSNKAAQALYKKMGFVQRAQRKGYYENRETALVLEKVFKRS